MNKFKITCRNCENEADVMAYRRLEEKRLSITYICPYCGEYDEEIEFMYENK